MMYRRANRGERLDISADAYNNLIKMIKEGRDVSFSGGDGGSYRVSTPWGTSTVMRCRYEDTSDKVDFPVLKRGDTVILYTSVTDTNERRALDREDFQVNGRTGISTMRNPIMPSVYYPDYWQAYTSVLGSNSGGGNSLGDSRWWRSWPFNSHIGGQLDSVYGVVVDDVVPGKGTTVDVVVDGPALVNLTLPKDGFQGLSQKDIEILEDGELDPWEKRYGHQRVSKNTQFHKPKYCGPLISNFFTSYYYTPSVSRNKCVPMYYGVYEILESPAWYDTYRVSTEKTGPLKNDYEDITDCVPAIVRIDNTRDPFEECWASLNPNGLTVTNCNFQDGGIKTLSGTVWNQSGPEETLIWGRREFYEGAFSDNPTGRTGYNRHAVYISSACSTHVAAKMPMLGEGPHNPFGIKPPLPFTLALSWPVLWRNWWVVNPLTMKPTGNLLGDAYNFLWRTRMLQGDLMATFTRSNRWSPFMLAGYDCDMTAADLDTDITISGPGTGGPGGPEPPNGGGPGGDPGGDPGGGPDNPGGGDPGGDPPGGGGPGGGGPGGGDPGGGPGGPGGPQPPGDPPNPPEPPTGPGGDPPDPGGGRIIVNDPGTFYFNWGDDFSAQMTATGGRPPYTWSIQGGELPPELSIDSETGVISGTFTDDGNGQTQYTAIVAATDTLGDSGSNVIYFINAGLLFEWSSSSSGSLTWEGDIGHGTYDAGTVFGLGDGEVQVYGFFINGEPSFTMTTNPSDVGAGTGLPTGLTMAISDRKVYLSGTLSSPSSSPESHTWKTKITDDTSATLLSGLHSMKVQTGLTEIDYTSFPSSTSDGDVLDLSPTVTGGSGNISYSVTSGYAALEAIGLSFNNNNGKITGTVADTVAGTTQAIVIQVEDLATGTKESVTKTFSFPSAGTFEFENWNTATALGTYSAGSSVGQDDDVINVPTTLDTSYGTSGVQTGGSFPSGLSFSLTGNNVSLGFISPMAIPGTYVFTLSVRDNDGTVATTGNLTLVIS